MDINLKLYFDDEFIKTLKQCKPKRGGIYAKAYKDLLHDIEQAYYKTRKAMKAEQQEHKLCELCMVEIPQPGSKFCPKCQEFTNSLKLFFGNTQSEEGTP